MNRGLLLAGAALGFIAWRIWAQPASTLSHKLRMAVDEIAYFPVKIQTAAFDMVGLPPPGRTNSPKPIPGFVFSVSALLDLIARGESGFRGYDSYYSGARIRPSLPVSQMTLQQVQDFQRRNAAARSVSTAVGRYQFIARTLSRLLTNTGISLSSLFTSQIQDTLATLLLRERGLNQFLAGQMSAANFAASLAREWAALPAGPDGLSYYHGQAGNRARITWPEIMHVLGVG